jgi:Phage capsid family
MPYGKNSEHSFFRDLYAAVRAAERMRASRYDPVLRGKDPGDPEIRAINVPTGAEAMKRLAAANFDLSAAGASGLIPAGSLPPYLADLFKAAARNAAVLADALHARPLPADRVDAAGTSLTVPSMSTGATVAIQATENTGVSNTDPVFQLATAPIGYAAGMVNLSRQLLDRAVYDQFLSSELGRAAGERIDIQLLNGSGSSGQTRGLLNLSGVVATTYTDASPTVGEALSRIGSNYADISSATAGYGRAPDVIILHPRRYAWLSSQSDTAGQLIRPNFLAGNPLICGSIPTNLGAGTNEDVVVHAVSEAVSAFVDEPSFELFPDVLSGTLEVRARVVARCALVVPLSVAVGKVSSTGLSSPSFA